MTWGIDWTSFLPAAVLVSLIPGANQLLSLRNAIRQGAIDATVALVGRFSAFAIMVLAVVAGLGALLTNAPGALTIVRWVGVAYLTWLGVAILWRSWQASRAETSSGEPEEASRSRRSLVRQEFVVAITNPKAVLLFAAFLPQFIRSPEQGPVVQLLLVGFSYIAIEAVTALLYTFAGGYLSALRLTTRSSRTIDFVTAGSFLLLAAFLLFD